MGLRGKKPWKRAKRLMVRGWGGVASWEEGTFQLRAEV